MASISTSPDGRRRILFIDRDSNRKAIWLGRMSKKTAMEIKGRVEAINAAIIAGQSLDRETASWLGKIGDSLHAKLARAGLTEPRQPAETMKQGGLDQFLFRYIAGRTDVKQKTLEGLSRARRILVEFFGPDKPLEQITKGDAKRWIIWLRGRYAKATVGRMIVWAKQFFGAAIDDEIVGKSPFNKIKPPDQKNDSRKFLVTRDVIRQVLDACPDHEWRLIVALSRFSGLRCPSEHLSLRWQDVDWAKGKFWVTSPKTEHHAGKEGRFVPIFPELRPYLQDAFEQASEGATFVISRYRGPDQNLRTQFQRIILRAGLKPWPRPFHNLRATCETELAGSWPLHVVASWLGHDALIAQRHYLSVPDSYFTQAADSAPDSAQTAHFAAQHPTRTQRAPNAKTPEKPGFSADSPAISAVAPQSLREANWALTAMLKAARAE